MTKNIIAHTLTSSQASKEATIEQEFTEIDNALSETLTIDLTSANAAITATQLKSAWRFNATNASAARTVTFSTPSKRPIQIASAAANTATVTFVVGTTNIALAPGEARIIYLDGTANGAALANVVSFEELIDVDVSTPPTDGQIFRWNDTAKKLVPVNHTIAAETDVTISSIAQGQFLRWDLASTKWKNWNWSVTSKSADYTFVLGDADSTVELTGATGHTFTVPLNSSVAFPIGTTIEVVQGGTGALTIAAASGVTVSAVGSGLALASQWQTGKLRKIGADAWVFQTYGAAGALSSLSDVSVTTGPAVDGYVLSWNNTASKYELIAASGLGGGASNLDGLSDVTLTTPADGDVLRYDNATSLWLNKPSVGLAPNDPPLASAMTWVNQGSAAVADGVGALIFTSDAIGNSGTTRRGLVQTAPATPWHCVMWLDAYCPLNDFNGFGVFLYESATDKAMEYVFQSNHFVIPSGMNGFNTHLQIQNCATFSTTTASTSILISPIWQPNWKWFRVGDDGTNITFDIGPDGNNWINLHSEARATHFTTKPNKAGIELLPFNSDGVTTAIRQIRVFCRHFAFV